MQAGLDPERSAIGLGPFLGYLVPVTIGNVIGGALVGVAYWFAYLRPKGEES